jgi:hypothetical protein
MSRRRPDENVRHGAKTMDGSDRCLAVIVGGSAYKTTPLRAVQRAAWAAWETLNLKRLRLS